jgi:cytidylate kinase
MRTSATVVVTIARQLGSGGSFLGQQLARRLDYKYMDREILREAARRLGHSEEVLLGQEERISPLWEKILRAFSPGAPEAHYVPPPVPLVLDKELFQAEAKIIREVSDLYDAIIVGRGAVHILKGRPGLVHVFLHAAKEFRIRRIMEVYGLSDPGQARSMIERSDAQRAAFVQSMAGAGWTDARNYHLCVDTSIVGFPLAEAWVAQLVNETERRLASGKNTGAG